MFARIVKVRDGTVIIDGVKYTLEEAMKLPIVSDIARDEHGDVYLIIKEKLR